MQPPSHWRNWAEKLERWGLKGLTATLLESTGPISTIIAQLMYASSPFISSTPSNTWSDLVRIFENPAEGQAFAHFLKEGDSK